VLLLAVAPRFVDGATPSRIEDRRASYDGFLALAVRVQLPTTLAMRVTGNDGREILLRGEGRPGDLGSVPIGVREGRVWELAIGRPANGSLRLPISIAVLGALLGFGLALTVRELQRRARESQAEAEARDRQLGLVEEAGVRLQQSLDLGELLPAFAVALVTDFGLDPVEVQLADGEGHLTQAFRTGVLGDPPLARDPDAIPPGHRVDLPLRRGWRMVGHLAGRSTRTLHAPDITALHALGEMLAVAITNAQLLDRERDAAGRLRELDALKSAFVGTVSHELRTAMTAITGFSELLDDHWDTFADDRRHDLVTRIRRNGGSLRHMVDDLLDFTRLEQHRVVLNRYELDLGDQVEQIMERMAQLTVDHEVVLRVGSAPVLAWVDPFAIERMVSNLLSNAVKYSPAGSCITVSVDASDDEATIIVDDEGPGIPPEERGRVFARFYRRDDSVTIATKGAGIGLAILGDFAAASGGRVAISDAAGGGARFTVTLPVTAPAAEPTTSAGDASPLTSTGGQR
jgi:signal transduction histidine kinase